MVNKDMVGKAAKIIIVILAIIYAIYVVTDIIQPSAKINEKKLFPGVIGNAILMSNETGIYFINNIVSYDNFSGDIVQGYKANYSGINGTIIIFMAQMANNMSAEKSLNEMVIRNGYNESMGSNESIDVNATVIKLPVNNPQVFIMQKNEKSLWHYVYAKSDKVYWIGFSKPDMEYQVSMMMEIYRNIDKEKENLIAE